VSAEVPKRSGTTVLPLLTVLPQWPVGNDGRLTLPVPGIHLWIDLRIDLWIDLRRIVKGARHDPSVGGVGLQQLVVRADDRDSAVLQKGDAVSVV